jgi:hypothetical protein
VPVRNGGWGEGRRRGCSNVLPRQLQTSTHTTTLARSLAREPARTTAGRLTSFGLVLLLPAMCWIVPAIISIAEPYPGVSRWVAALSTVIFFVVLTTPGGLLLSVAVRRIRRNGRVVRGRRHADAVWQAGFYCHRCGVAFWPFSPAPGILLPHSRGKSRSYLKDDLSLSNSIPAVAQACDECSSTCDLVATVLPLS